MPKARARLASAWPMRPMPMIPSRLPVIRRPSIQVGVQPAHCPFGMTCEPSTSRRAVERMSAIVMSAVSSVITPGVLVTVMPRLSALVTSIWSTPLPKLAISRICSPACAIMAALIWSVIVGHDHVGLPHGLDDLGLRHRLVLEIEAGVEQFAHAGFDEFGEPPRDDDDGFLLGHDRRPFSPVCAFFASAPFSTICAHAFKRFTPH